MGLCLPIDVEFEVIESGESKGEKRGEKFGDLEGFGCVGGLLEREQELEKILLLE